MKCILTKDGFKLKKKLTRSCQKIELFCMCMIGFEIYFSNQKFSLHRTGVFWHNKTQKERKKIMYGVNKLSNLNPSLVKNSKLNIQSCFDYVNEKATQNF